MIATRLRNSIQPARHAELAAGASLPPLDRARQQLDGLENHDADNGIGQALSEHAAPREAEMRQAEQLVETHEYRRVNDRARYERHESRQRAAHDELRARLSHHIPDDGQYGPQTRKTILWWTDTYDHGWDCIRFTW